MAEVGALGGLGVAPLELQRVVVGVQALQPGRAGRERAGEQAAGGAEGAGAHTVHSLEKKTEFGVIILALGKSWKRKRTMEERDKK